MKLYYKDWTITVADPASRYKWEYVHKEYDGAPDSGTRNWYGFANSINKCIEDIDLFEAENEIT